MAQFHLGTARARLGPAAAIVDATRGLAAAMEENRMTRARESSTEGPPALAIAELLRFLGCRDEDIVARGGVGEEGEIDAHLAHAAYAFHASGFDEAAVVVCANEASLWVGRASGGLERIGARSGDGSDLKHDAARETGEGGGGGARTRRSSARASPWDAACARYRIAAEYSRLTERLGLCPGRDEHLVEARARAGHAEAASVQRALGDELLDLLSAARETTGCARVCLSGGIFFNTSFTTVAAASGIFDEVYVPPHPGRNGSALGAALLLCGRRIGAIASPFLGPAYTDAEIKRSLENCKLSFDLLHEQRLMEQVLHALSRGRLVGWYHGRLEWGPRALGHRSVLADPFAPHVLDNLNGFLKHRPAYRAYGVSIPASQLAEYFEVPQHARAMAGAAVAHSVPPGDEVRAEGAAPAAPAARAEALRSGIARSPFMQFEYRPKDLDRFRTILPPGVETIRVHTVDATEPRYLRLLELWGERSGSPVLVNTSFNGFHEPLVCSPRDAVRVFYGTGLDVLALENFYLRK
jgi:carbamoyltransferase